MARVYCLRGVFTMPSWVKNIFRLRFACNVSSISYRYISTSPAQMSKKTEKPVIAVVSLFKGLVAELSEYCPSASFVYVDHNKGLLAESLLDSEIIVGDPPLLGALVYQLPKLKWVQSTYAGIDGIYEHKPPGKQPGFVLTKLAGIFGPLMAEYVIGHIIARERKFSLAWEGQKKNEWLFWSEFHHRALWEMSIGIIGFGDIGQVVAKYCKSMRMTVNVVQRTIPNVKLPCVDNAFTTDELAECLRQCDYFCNILPSASSTRNLLSEDVFENCKERKTVLINIGRGDTLSEQTILKALDNQWIGGAILDVFDTEPLPANSPLWSRPEVTITPHISGLTRKNQIGGLFVENYTAYQAGKPLKYAVDWNKGY